MRRTTRPAVLILAFAVSAWALAFAAKSPRRAIPQLSWSKTQQAAHLLSRLSYGARPGDLDRALALGPAAYIERQLNPLGIDDSELEAKLRPLKTIRMSSLELAQLSPRPAW